MGSKSYPSKFIPPMNVFNFQKKIRWLNFTGSLDPTQQLSQWQEQIGNQSPGTDTMSVRSAQSTLFAWVPNDRQSMYDFQCALLGYHFTKSTQDSVLAPTPSPSFVGPPAPSLQTFSHSVGRVNPQQHPKNSMLYAKRISSINGIGFRGTSTDSPKGSAQIQKGLIKYAKYAANLIGVDFEPIKYDIWEDTDSAIGNGSTEYNRYVEGAGQVKAYVGTVPKGNFKFAEGTPLNKQFVGELNFIEVKTTFNLIWRNVPYDYVHDTVNYSRTMGYPTKLKTVIGNVNSIAFMGYPPGTLLLLEPEIEKYQCPVLMSSNVPYTNTGASSAILNGLPNIPFFLCDVTLPIVHFDPPNNSAANRGHNIKPWWASNPLTYYLVTNDGTLTGVTIYGAQDFNNLFTHWAD